MLGPLLEDPVAAGDAIAALRRYSLVSPRRGRAGVGAPAGPGRSPLDQLPAEVAGQWRQAAAALIEAAIPADTELPATWPVCAALLPHAQAVLGLTSPKLRVVWMPRPPLACAFAPSLAAVPGYLLQGERDGGSDEVECLALFGWWAR